MKRRDFLAAPAILSLSSLLGKPACARTPRPAIPAPIADAGSWAKTFEDDFTGPIDRLWTAVNDKNFMTQSARTTGNVIVDKGELALKLGNNPDPASRFPWTAGYVRTTAFRQQYGYFECEMRIANEAGVNNAFWLISDSRFNAETSFEIDVVEAKYPNSAQMHVRRWKPNKEVQTRTYRYNGSLADDFHRFGLLWTETDLIFYFDDKETFRVENQFCHSPADVRLSNAVARFAGRNDGDVAGAATSIGWVRVYEKNSSKR